LAGLDPYLPLRRGYSLVQLKDQAEIVRRADQVQAGDTLEITTYEARIRARVEKTQTRLPEDQPSAIGKQ
jgi:exodeoxyribonuclease VII large subunit